MPKSKNLEEEIEDSVEIILNSFKVNLVNPTAKRKRKMARMVSNIIHDDLPRLQTGYVSRKLIRKGYRYGSATKDHFHSRQRVGKVAVKLFLQNRLTPTKLASILRTACRVNLVTSKENRILQKIQNEAETEHLHWKAQYRLAGITLVQDPGTPTRKYIHYHRWAIGGIVYDCPEKAAAVHGVKKQTIINRCENQKEKFSEYRSYPVDIQLIYVDI